MRICEAGWIVDTLGQAEHLLSQLLRGLGLPSSDIKTYQATQHGEELRGLPHLLAQLVRPLIGGFHVRSPNALGGHQRLAEGNLQGQLLLAMLGSVWEGCEQ